MPPEAPVLPVANATPPVVPPGTDNAPADVPETVQRLMKALGMDDEPAQQDSPEGEPRPKADPPKADTPKPKADAKPASGAPTPDEKPITVRPGKELRRPELPIATPAPRPAVPASEEFKADPAWERTLEESEREILDDAREAEKLFPDKFKGLGARTAKFLKDHADLTTKEEFDDQDPKYQQWVQANQPKLNRRDIRDIETARATATVKQEYDGKFADMRHQNFLRDAEPKMQKEGETVFAELTHLALPEDMTKAIKEDGFEKAKEVFGLEIETAQNVITVATDDIMEFKRITTKDPETGRPLQSILEKMPVGDPDDPAFQREMQRFHQHKRLGQLVEWLCEDFKNKAPAQQQQRNGRWYATREEMGRIKPEERHRFWTFTNAELIDMAKKNVPLSVNEAVRRRREEFKRYGWSGPVPKAPATAKPSPQPPPTPTNSPRVPAATPVPDGGDPAADIDARAQRMAAAFNRG